VAEDKKTLLDAVIASAHRNGAIEWKRYEEIYPNAREMFWGARLCGDNVTLRWVDGGPETDEAYALEDAFLQWFANDVQARRWIVRGVPPGGHEAVSIDPALITVEAFTRLRDDLGEWELAGVVFHAVHVVDGPPSEVLVRRSASIKFDLVLKILAGIKDLPHDLSPARIEMRVLPEFKRRWAQLKPDDKTKNPVSRKTINEAYRSFLEARSK
jgi:hypothetical protein